MDFDFVFSWVISVIFILAGLSSIFLLLSSNKIKEMRGIWKFLLVVAMALFFAYLIAFTHIGGGIALTCTDESDGIWHIINTFLQEIFVSGCVGP